MLICFYLHTLWKKFKRTHRTTLHFEITTWTEHMLFPIIALISILSRQLQHYPPQVITCNKGILRRIYLGWAYFTIDASHLTIEQPKIPTPNSTSQPHSDFRHSKHWRYAVCYNNHTWVCCQLPFVPSSIFSMTPVNILPI